MTTAPEPIAGVDLAQEPDFRLGAMQVSPSACRVRTGEHDERVEPRVMQVLVVLARQAGRTVSRDQLIEACWDGRIVSDDAISRVIAQVRGLARGHAPSPFELETVPKVGFRLIAAGQVGAGQEARPVASWRRPAAMAAAAMAVVVIAAIGGWAVWRARTPAAPAGQNGRVEVVQFEARRPDAELRRLSVEMGDSLVRVLSAAGVSTAPRVASPGEGASANDAELRIAGSIDRDGDAYVANVQVFDRKSGLVLLSARMQRPIARPRGFADETAVGVASSLRCALDDRRRSRRRMDPAVFGLFINTCDAFIREGNDARMLETSRRLVRAAPDLAPAHAIHAFAQASAAVSTDHSEDEVAVLRRGARASAARAIELDRRIPRAYLAIARSYPNGGNWEVREANLRRARTIDPSAHPGTIMQVYLLREVGRLREAREIARQANAAGDPTTLLTVEEVFLAAQTGDLAGARALIEPAALRDPREADGVRWTLAFWWEDVAAALAATRRLAPGENNPAELACYDKYLARLGDAVVRGLPPECGSISPDWRVRMLAREGDLDSAYAEIARPRPNSRSVLFLLYYPEMKAFRRDPRFMPLAHRLGLTDYWLTSDRWPDFCAEPDLPYDCKAVARALHGAPKARPA